MVIRVGIYDVIGVTCGTVSMVKTLSCYDVSVVTSVTTDTLCSIDVLIVGGGDARALKRTLAGAPIKALRAWLNVGGSYLGICAGAVIACDVKQGFSLFPGIKLHRDNLVAESGLCGTVTLAWTDAIFQSHPRPHPQLWYENGPLMKIKSTTKPIIIARYDTELAQDTILEGAMPGKVAIVCTESKGRIMLSGPHIELCGTLLCDAVSWCASVPMRQCANAS